MAAYEKALGSPPRPIGEDRTIPGTLNAVLVGYYDSQMFRALAPSTQVMRRAILERLRERHGDRRIATLPVEFIADTLDRLKPIAARNWLKALRHLLDYAVAKKLRPDNPARGFKLPKPPRVTHRRAWTDDEVAQYEATHPIGSKARLAFALGLYTGQRLGDVARMGKRHIRNGEITIRQGKTGAQLTLPVLPELQACLSAIPAGSAEIESLTFLVTKSGRPFRPTDLSEQFRVWCNEAGLPTDCMFHGLRATRCTQLADAGCSTHEIAAWSGHASIKEVERYTKAANQKRLAIAAVARTKR
jgi:integrase